MKPTIPMPDKQGCEDDPMYGVCPIDYYTASTVQRLVDAAYEAGKADAMQWGPIETAPKDEAILLYGAKRLEMCVGMFHSRDGWVTDTTSEWVSMYPPTHWQPIPCPPEQPK